MKILITGASGFVGQNLCKYLRSEAEEVFCLSLRNNEWENRLPDQADAIIHLAGKAHDTSNTSQSADYFKINRDLTIQLFDWFLKADVKDFFYFSSVKAVADTVEGILLEDVIACPITPYGKSKLEAEQYLLSYVLPEGKRLFIIRPCMIHGPGNKGNLNLLYQVVQKGMPWPLAAFDNQRSFLGIDNLNYLIKQMLLNKNIQPGVYNFADDNSISTKDLISLIGITLGKNARLWNIPVEFVKVAVKIGDLLPLPLNSERLKKLTESYVVSNSKVKKALGIDHLPSTVEQGLERTICSFKKNNF